MNLNLTSYDQALLHGEHGPAAQLAMSIMTRMVGIYGTNSLLDITAAHIDSSLYMGDATLEFAERLANSGAKVKVPSTLNVSGVDEHHWQEWSTPPDHARKAHRQMMAYQNMGCIPTWTCAPYQTEHRPRFGQQIAWGESNAIAFANTVIGARTERYPDLLDICAAITGRVPAAGLHLEENRAGQFVIRIDKIPLKLQEDDSFYPVLGHWIGKISGDQIPIVEGIKINPTEDQLKSFCAAMASSSALGLCHIVGVTPEAATLKEACQGKFLQRSVELDMSQLREARDELTTTKTDQLDMVVLGSPHFSFAEFKKLVPLITNKRCHSKVQFLVTTSRTMKELADRANFLTPLQEFGGKITVDTCIITTPMLPPAIKTLMTNSAKYAFYTPSLLNKQIAFGSTEDCVHSAISGFIIRDDSLWEK